MPVMDALSFSCVYYRPVHYSIKLQGLVEPQFYRSTMESAAASAVNIYLPASGRPDGAPLREGSLPHNTSVRMRRKSVF